MGNSPVTGELPSQRPVTRSFDVFFDLHLNKWLSKQSWRWWFETLSCPLWCHCNVAVLFQWWCDDMEMLYVRGIHGLLVDLQRANNVWFCFLCCSPGKSIGCTMEFLVISNAVMASNTAFFPNKHPIKSTCHQWITPHERAVIRRIIVFCVVCPNKLLNKQSSCQ